MDSKENEIIRDKQKPHTEESAKPSSKSEIMQTKELMEDMEEDLPKEAEDMDLDELDLDETEKGCSKKGQGYVSRRQI